MTGGGAVGFEVSRKVGVGESGNERGTTGFYALVGTVSQVSTRTLAGDASACERAHGDRHGCHLMCWQMKASVS